MNNSTFFLEKESMEKISATSRPSTDRCESNGPRLSFSDEGERERTKKNRILFSREKKREEGREHHHLENRRIPQVLKFYRWSWHRNRSIITGEKKKATCGQSVIGGGASPTPGEERSFIGSTTRHTLGACQKEGKRNIGVSKQKEKKRRGKLYTEGIKKKKRK